MKSYTAVLAIARDGSVTVSETLSVMLASPANGITRSLVPDEQYTGLIAADTVSTTTGSVTYSNARYFQVGNPNTKLQKEQTFTLSYRLDGIVLPYAAGPVLAWRMNLGRPLPQGAITIRFPDAASAARCEVVIVPAKPHRFYTATKLKTEVRGAEVSAAIERPLKDWETVEAYAEFPAGSVDPVALAAAFDKRFGKNTIYSIARLAYRATVRRNLSVDVDAAYDLSIPNKYARPCQARRETYSVGIPYAEQSKPDKDSWRRDLYLYNLSGSGYTDRTLSERDICYTLAPGTSAQLKTGYTTYGNFYDTGTLFVDLELPGLDAKRTGVITVSIDVPDGVSTDLVRPQFLLKRTAYNELLLRPLAVPFTWEKNRLTATIGGLLEDQTIMVRLFLPADAFTRPFIAARAIMYVRTMWNFNTGLLIAVIVVVLVIGAIIVISIMAVRSGRPLPSLPKIAKREKKKAPAASIAIPPAIEAQIREHDPAFTAAHFLSRVTAISTRLQEAWGRGDMHPVRNYVSQGVYNRFRLQLDLMIHEEGVIDCTSDFAITDARVTGISSARNYQTLHVRITAQIRDLTIDASLSDDDKRKLLAEEPLETFTEIYSFTRRTGAKTDTTKDWLKGQCPNCGFVPENFSEVNKCPNCATIYNSGEFEWVLSEITQLEEWRPTSCQDIPGLAALEEKNLSINREVIEDRASYLFWRWVYARAKGMPSAIARDATKEFLQAFSAQRSAISEIAVGAVDLERVSQDGDTVRAVVAVKWSAARARDAEPEYREHAFTLMLPVATTNEYGLAEHSCPNCGAPLPELDALTCAYCGADLPSAVNDWMLESVEQRA